jgi:hypothetical protein
MTVIYEYARECLDVRVERQLDHEDVQECLAELSCARGVSVHLRSENGLEVVAMLLREWLKKLQLKPLVIEPDNPW